MADSEHVEILKQGTKPWNKWRAENPKVKPDFFGANLCGVDLNFGAGPWSIGQEELCPANLRRADLCTANLSGADLRGADLSGANLSGADLSNADLSMANLHSACVHRANLSGVNLHGANLSGAVFDDSTESSAMKISCAKFDLKTSFLYVDITRTDWSFNPCLKRHIEDQQWLEAWRRQNQWTAYIFYPLWRVSCNCGRSLCLWAAWSVFMSFCFACVFYFHLGEESMKISDLPWSLNTMIYYSVVTFTTLGFGDVTPKTTEAAYWIMAEVILGYFMLGGLISILATKLARRA